MPGAMSTQMIKPRTGALHMVGVGWQDLQPLLQRLFVPAGSILLRSHSDATMLKIENCFGLSIESQQANLYNGQMNISTKNIHCFT